MQQGWLQSSTTIRCEANYQHAYANVQANTRVIYMSVSYESVNGADAMNLAVASGIAVFPCKPWPDKLPLTKHGFKDATTDLDQITAW